MDSGETGWEDFDEALTLAPRCVVAGVDGGRPVAGGSLLWWDGAGLWLPGSPAAEVIAALRRDPQAAVHVGPAVPGAKGVVAVGSAQLYGPHDLVGLAVRGLAVGIAASGLALKYAAELGALARDLPRVVAGEWPDGLVLARVLVDAAHHVEAQPAGAGIGPALPSVVPPAVRREVTGQRDIMLATVQGARPMLAPAVWSADLRVETADGDDVGEGPAAAVVAVGSAGVAIEGVVREGRLRPERARWWSGLVGGSAPIRAGEPGGVRLPD